MFTALIKKLLIQRENLHYYFRILTITVGKGKSIRINIQKIGTDKVATKFTSIERMFINWKDWKDIYWATKNLQRI